MLEDSLTDFDQPEKSQDNKGLIVVSQVKKVNPSKHQILKNENAGSITGRVQ